MPSQDYLFGQLAGRGDTALCIGAAQVAALGWRRLALPLLS